MPRPEGFDEISQSEEYVGRVERIWERTGEPPEGWNDPNGRFYLEYLDMRDIVNDRWEWIKMENQEAVLEWLIAWDLVDPETEFDDLRDS